MDVLMKFDATVERVLRFYDLKLCLVKYNEEKQLRSWMKIFETDKKSFKEVGGSEKLYRKMR